MGHTGLHTRRDHQLPKPRVPDRPVPRTSSAPEDASRVRVDLVEQLLDSGRAHERRIGAPAFVTVAVLQPPFAVLLVVRDPRDGRVDELGFVAPVRPPLVEGERIAPPLVEHLDLVPGMGVHAPLSMRGAQLLGAAAFNLGNGHRVRSAWPCSFHGQRVMIGVWRA